MKLKREIFTMKNSFTGSTRRKTTRTWETLSAKRSFILYHNIYKIFSLRICMKCRDPSVPEIDETISKSKTTLTILTGGLPGIKNSSDSTRKIHDSVYPPTPIKVPLFFLNAHLALHRYSIKIHTIFSHVHRNFLSKNYLLFLHNAPIIVFIYNLL